MKNKTHFLTLFLIISSIYCFSQKKLTFSDAVNIAGKQRMLVYKMAKDKLFIEANKKVNESEKDLNNSIIEFELANEILKDYSPNDAIKFKINIQELTFKSYKAFLLDTTKKSMEEIISMNTIFFDMSDDVFSSFLEYSKVKSDKSELLLNNVTKLANASGTIRYLSQKLTYLHALNYYEIKTIYPKEISGVINVMDKALNYLTISEFNTLEIDDSLSIVLYYWNHLKIQLNESGQTDDKIGTMDPIKLHALCNTILEKTDPITKMYVDLLE